MPPISMTLEKTSQKTIDVSLYPTYNIFSSMLLLVKGGDEPGVHEWIRRIKADMTAQQLEDNVLVLIGFHYVIFPDDGQITFPAYLHQLENSDPITLRDKMLNMYAELWQEETTPDVNWGEVLASAESYINFLRSRFGDELVDVEVETRAYSYVTDPPAMQSFIVEHMTWLWESYFKFEWMRIEAILKECVRSFKGIDLAGMPRMEAASFVTGQDVSDAKWCKKIDQFENIVFVPNPHVGPYVQSVAMNNVTYVVFGARQPEGATDRIPELDRNEIVARLSALADDTRLHILQLVAERGEIRVQDVLEMINLSQPSVSRYLSQLTSAGYLHERRENGAKVYILNKDRIEKTLKAVSAFLLGN